MDDSDSSARGFETTDASARGILVAASFIVLGVLAAMAAAALLLFAYKNGAEPARTLGHEGSFTFGVEKKSSIEQTWNDLETDRRERSTEAGKAIPIERAIDIVVDEAKQIDGQPRAANP